jgi:DNA-binding NarL/FixJ family response regulator
MSPRFLIVEDQTLVRQLLIADIQKKIPGCRIIEAGSLDELKQLDTKGLGSVTLAIVDLELPDGNALDWVEAYTAREEKPKVLLLSSMVEDFVLARALRSRASGFVHKNDGRDSLTSGIELVLSGHLYYSPTVLRLRNSMESDPALFSKILSDKEQQILRLIAEGNSNEEIAEIEGSKVTTILFHRKNIMNKLNIHSAPELMRYAIQKGFASF